MTYGVVVILAFALVLLASTTAAALRIDPTIQTADQLLDANVDVFTSSNSNSNTEADHARRRVHSLSQLLNTNKKQEQAQAMDSVGSNSNAAQASRVKCLCGGLRFAKSSYTRITHDSLQIVWIPALGMDMSVLSPFFGSSCAQVCTDKWSSKAEHKESYGFRVHEMCASYTEVAAGKQYSSSNAAKSAEKAEYLPAAACSFVNWDAALTLLVNSYTITIPDTLSGEYRFVPRPTRPGETFLFQELERVSPINPSLTLKYYAQQLTLAETPSILTTLGVLSIPPPDPDPARFTIKSSLSSYAKWKALLARDEMVREVINPKQQTASNSNIEFGIG